MWLSGLGAISAVAYAVLAPIAGPVPVSSWIAIGTLTTLMVLAFVATWMGAVRVGVRLTIVSIWTPAAALLLLAGRDAPSTELFTVVVLFAALAAGRRVATVLTLMSVTSVVAVWLWLPEGLDPQAGQIMSQRRPMLDLELLLFGAAIALWWSARTEKAAREREALAGTEEQLQFERERTRAIVESVHDIVVILDADGIIIFENAAVERVLGFMPGERVGQSMMSHVHPDDVVRAGSAMTELLADPQKLVRIVTRFRQKDGGWRWLETFERNLIHVSAIGGILGVGRDVTEQRDMQSRLDASERLETVGRLAGGIAHDFNNLLTAILGNTELARDLATDAGPMTRYLDGVKQAAERARDLTRKLLAFARREITQPVVIDLRDRLRDAQELLHRILGEDIVLSVQTGAEPLSVLIDPVQFEQIILNLAVNARDAMPVGGTFSIHGERGRVDALDSGFVGALAPGPVVRLLVRDSGDGMPPEVVARVFEPFFTTKELGRGTGLGLSTAYGSVAQAGGAIRVTSQVGRGTTFEILLPQSNAPLAVATNDPAVITPRKSATVLVVEDDAGVREFMVEVLLNAGFRVREAADGLAGCALVDAYAAEIDVLVTDVVMPNRNGLELAAYFRRARPNGPVLLVTGYSKDPTIEEKAAELQAAVLLKPFTVEQLLTHTRRLLRTSAGN